MKLLIEKDGVLLAPDELTIHTVDQLRDDLVSAINGSDKQVTMLMDQVEHIDTAAVQVLVAARQFAHSAQRELVLKDASADSQEVISGLGLNDGLFGQAAGGQAT